MISEKMPYLLAILCLFQLNMAAGNFAARRERGISKVSLPDKIKRMLFPFFYVKRVTNIVLFNQIFNGIIFVIILSYFLLTKDDFQRVFQIYWNFEGFDILFLQLFIGGRLRWLWSHELTKIKRCGENWMQELFRELNGEIHSINNNDMMVARPENVNGCVFIMRENMIQYIKDICYKDILYKLLDMNYMLVCIDEYAEKNVKKYKMTMEQTIHSFSVCEKPFFYMGSEADSMFETLKMDHVFKSSGIIWLCELKRKKIMKYIIKSLETFKNEEIIPDEHDICIINAYMKNAEGDLEDWMKERGNRRG